MTEIDPTVLRQLTAAVERCAIAPGEFEITYEEYLQSEEIRVLSSSLTDDQIESLQAIGRTPPFAIVTFLSRDVLQRSSAISEERNKAEAREWFRAKGLLDRLPVYSPNDDPMEFARRLEEFCGIEPGTAFEINQHANVITPKNDWIAKPLRKGWLWRKLHGPQHERQVECLMRAMSATNGEQGEVRFGFVGNEAYSDREPQI